MIKCKNKVINVHLKWREQMIRKKIKSENGITMIALVFTIVILLILATTIAYNIDSSNNPAYYKNMISDIRTA